MGIEPTGDEQNPPPNGFEDRGRHQSNKHFLKKPILPCGGAKRNRLHSASAASTRARIKSLKVRIVGTVSSSAREVGLSCISVMTSSI
jgi:hypothetical protein